MKASGFAILIGGRSSRMGGKPKGLLEYEGQSLVRRLVNLGTQLGHAPFLVGDIDAYDQSVPNVPRIADVPHIQGPTAGLLAALRSNGCCVVVSCDLPFLTPACVRNLPRDGTVSAYRHADGLWEPFPSFYSGMARVHVEAKVEDGCRSFQELFSALAFSGLATPIPIDKTNNACFHDWDEPIDL